MKLDVLHALRNPGTGYAFSVEQTMAPQDVGGEEIVFDPVCLSGQLTANEDGSVVVDGSLTTTAHAHCAKCMAPASCPVTGQFREVFIHGGDPEDDEIFAYEGAKLEFEKLTLTHVLLNLPMRFLCKEDCRGFEQYAEANQTKHCQDDANIQRPFAALQQLLAEKSDNEKSDSKE